MDQFSSCSDTLFCQTFRQHQRHNTYTEIGGHSLSPHAGGFSWVTHHLHGVHLNTNNLDEHTALINRPHSHQVSHCKGGRLQRVVVYVQPAVFCRLCGDKGVITAGLLLLNGPVGDTQLY